MSPDDPRHGTNAGAIQHWRDGEEVCSACLIGKRRASKRAALARINGTPGMTVLGEVAYQVIIETPRDQLARATGLTVHKLSRLAGSGPESKVHRTTRDRIVAAGSRDYWTPVGIQRRLKAIHCLGWSIRAFAAEMENGHATSLLRLMYREVPQFVRRDVALAIIATYDRLCMTPRMGAAATRSKNLATRNGWPPPLAWDNIDDPSEQPDGWQYQAPTRLEQLLDLHARGAGISEVCARLHLSKAALQKWCGNHDLHRIYRELSAREVRAATNQYDSVEREAS